MLYFGKDGPTKLLSPDGMLVNAGTPLGDPIEVGAAAAVLVEGHNAARVRQPLALSGSKSWVGHSGELATDFAGLLGGSGDGVSGLIGEAAGCQQRCLCFPKHAACQRACSSLPSGQGLT